MSLDTAPSPVAAMRPIAFAGRCGWLHDPGPQRGGLGVVVVSPLGRDARCVHLPMRLFAERLAQSGVAVLRYDHADTGDSLDLAPPADAVTTWLADVVRAIETLRAQTGVERVVLCGVRLGGLIAAAATAEVDGLMLFGPVASGRSWTAKQAFAARAAASEASSTDGGLDTDGMTLSAATVRSLSALDLLNTPALPRVLVLTQGKTTDAYIRHLQAQGVTVREAPFAGHAELFIESHSNTAPDAAFDRALSWLRDSFPADLAATPATPPPLVAADARVFEDAILELPGVVERQVRFGAGLNGVLSLPAAGQAQPRAVLFLNTGGDPRAGIGRLAVRAGRDLARQGVASLRFDFAGLGDSPLASGEPRSHVYEKDRGEEIAAALALLASRGFTEVAAVGVCSGAYHALHAALNEPRITGVFAVNPLRLIWRGEEIVFGERASAYVDKMGDLSTWTRLLQGRIQLGAIARASLSKLKTWREAQARNGAGGELRKALARLSERGSRLHLLVGAEDAALDEVEAYLGRGAEALARLPGMTVQIEPGLDHGLSRSASRETALTALWRWLDLPRPATAAGRAGCEADATLSSAA